MKKIIFFLIIVGFSFAVFAQQGILTLKSSVNQKFWLFIDDVLQNQYSTTSIQIVGLQYKAYKVRVEFDNANNFTFGQLMTIKRNPADNNYIVERAAFSYNRSVIRPLAVLNYIAPNYDYSNDYYHYLYPGFGSPSNYWNDNKGNSYSGYKLPYNYPGGYPGDPGYGHGSSGNLPPHGQGVKCMPQNDFNQLYTTIKKENFEDTKLTLAKQVTSRTMLCTDQVKQICQLFSFENNKLQYAKYAYRYCTDQQNYYLVTEVFSFKTSKDELLKFIGR